MRHPVYTFDHACNECTSCVCTVCMPMAHRAVVGTLNTVQIMFVKWLVVIVPSAVTPRVSEGGGEPMPLGSHNDPLDDQGSRK